MKLRAIIFKVLYILGILEHKVETINGIVRRVQRDIDKAQQIAASASYEESAIKDQMDKMVAERKDIRLERKKAEMLSENIKNTLLKGIV